MGIAIISVQRAYLVNNALVALEFRYKLMFQVFVHVKMVGCCPISSAFICFVTEKAEMGSI